MNASRADLALALFPLGVIGVGTLLCGVLAAVRRSGAARANRVIATLAFVAAIIAALVELYQKRFVDNGIFVLSGAANSRLAQGTLVIDRFSVFATVILCGFGLMSTLTSATSLPLLHGRGGLFYALLLSATGGGVVLASQHEMGALALGVGMEIVSLGTMLGLSKTNKRSVEAAYKYMVSGAVATAGMLLGLAILNGVSASTNLPVVAASGGQAPVLAALGALIVVAALAALAGLMPLPQWVPSIAETAPGPVVGVVLSIGIGSAVLALVRTTAAGFGGGIHWWVGCAAGLGILSVFYGALAALRESSVRRLLAYVAVAQTGFNLLGVVGFGTGTDGLPAMGVNALLFGLVITGVTLIGLFALIGVFEAGDVGDDIGDYRGIVHRNGPLGTLFALGLVGVAGLPPSGAFLAHLFALQSAVYVNYAWLAALGVIGMVCAAVPPLRLLVIVLGERERGEHALRPHVSRTTGWAIAAVCVFAAMLALLAEPLLRWGAGAAAVLPLH